MSSEIIGGRSGQVKNSTTVVAGEKLWYNVIKNQKYNPCHTYQKGGHHAGICLEGKK